MTTFYDFLKWYNDKDVIPTIQALKKMISFYHDNNIDMMKQTLTLPSLANRILHSSTNAKFFPFTYEDRELDNYIRSWLTGGPSIIFNRYAKVGVTKIENTQNVCKAIIGVDASQLYPYSMTLPMPTGPYTSWEFSDTEQVFKPRRSKTSRFEHIVMSFLQWKRPECTIQSQFTHSRQKRFGRYYVDGYCDHCRTVFEAMGCFHHFCECQDQRSLLLEDIEAG